MLRSPKTTNSRLAASWFKRRHVILHSRLPALSGDSDIIKPSPADFTEPRIEGYRIESLIGFGGMGTIWKARQLTTERTVALKLMHRAIAQNERGIKQFEQEIKLTAALNHPNIATIFQGGVSQDAYFYAMEYLDAKPLDVYVQEHQCDLSRVLNIIQIAAQAVQYAHDRGVIHRDLKPNNILVDDQGEPHVVDFGLARHIFTEHAEASSAGDERFVGTLAFSSPEQVSGKLSSVDHLSDVYSLGTVLYFLLTGTLPHDVDGTPAEVARRIVEEQPQPPAALNKMIDGDLQAIVLKALKKDRAQRYQSAAALANDIQRYLEGDPVHARPSTAAYLSQKWIQKHPRLILVAAIVVLCIYFAALTISRTSTDASRNALAAATAKYWNTISAANQAIAANDHAIAQDQLKNCPAYLRGWEWFWLAQLTDNSELTIKAHETDGRQVLASPDGLQLFTLGNYGEVKIWNADDGTLLDSMQFNYQGVAKLLHNSRDVFFTAMTADQTLSVIRFSQGSHSRLDLLVGNNGVEVVGITGQEDLYILNREQKTIEIWRRTSDGTMTRHATRPTTAQKALLSPDETILAAVTGGTITIHDVHSLDQIIRVECESPINKIAFIPKKHLLVAGSLDGRIILWNTISWSKQLAYTSPQGTFDDLAASDDEIVIYAVNGNNISIINNASGDIKTYQPTGHRTNLKNVSYAALSSRLAAIDAYGIVKLWLVNPPDDQKSTFEVPLAENKHLFHVGFSSDGSQAQIVYLDETAEWIHLRTQKRIDIGSIANNKVLRTAVSPNGQFLAVVRSDDKITIARIKDAEIRHAFDLNAKGVVAVQFSPNNEYIAAVSTGENSRLLVFSTKTGNQVMELDGNTIVAWSQDGRYLLTSYSLPETPDRVHVYVWDVQQWKLKLHHQLNADVVVGGAWSRDMTRFAVADNRGSAFIWKLADPQAPVVQITPDAGRPLSNVALSPDGKRLLTAGTSISLWDAAHGVKLLELAKPSDQQYVNAVFDSTGRSILAGYDKKIVVWRVQNTNAFVSHPAAH